MKSKFPGIIAVIVVSFCLLQCAKKGMPEGGPIDETPPKFLKSSPENYTTNFSKEEISILFDEFIKLENPQQQIIISPPIEPRPDIAPKGLARKDILIKLTDTLQENTTYTINFGKSIVDNNEGNPNPYFKYVFSTGNYIDSLEVSGFIEDSYLKETPPYVSVFLYEMDSTYSDSVVYNKIPRYVSYTRDSSVNFNLENLKGGKYQMVAMLDDNSNYKFNPKKDKIGFLDHPITIPTDSVYNISIFQEELPFDVKRPKLFKGNQLIVGYEGKPEIEDLELNILYPKIFKPTTRITRDTETDTLYYWFKEPIETDSLSMEVVTPNQRDTVFVRMTDIPRDSLNISIEPGGNIAYDNPIRLKANTPISEKNTDLISILNKDSIAVPFTSEIQPIANEILINFDKEESETYYFKALPGAVTDLFEQTNDTLVKKFTTKAYSEFGSVAMSLTNIRSYPIIIQLTSTKEEVYREQTLTSGNTFEFKNIDPGEYYLRIIYDTNNNGKWDTGNWLERKKPEKISYYPSILEVRANWDQNYPTFYLD